MKVRRRVTMPLSIILLGGSLAATSGESSVTLVAKRDGQLLGTHFYSTSIGSDGSLKVRNRMVLIKGARKVHLDDSTIYSKRGVPISGTMKASDSEKRGGEMSVRFDRKGASLTIRDGGKVTKRLMPLPRGASMLDPTIFWFIRDTPTAGKKFTFAEFLPSSVKWVIRNRT